MRILTLSIALALPFLASAQNPVVSGRITDASGAALPGAKIEIVGTATGVAAAATSNTEGYYVFPASRRVSHLRFGTRFRDQPPR